MRHAFVLIVALAGCGKGSKENRKICEQAAAKYTSCIAEILGPEMAAQAQAKNGVAACAADDKTVAMYRACLPRTDCGEFMTCMEDYARSSAPPIAADKPRVEQCKQHVKDGLRGIAMQVVLLGEQAHRNAGDKEHAQRCTLDESTPWESCLEPAEIDEVKRYGVQRQKECEAWSPELASCILRLPGARDCKPDEYPMWRLPLDEGPAGPPVAWSTPVADDDDYDDDAELEWAGGDLIVRDEKGVRALRDGEARWQASSAGMDVPFAINGTWLAARGTDDARGVHLIDLTTGKAMRVMEGTYVSVVGTGASGRLLAWTSSSEVFELSPAICAKQPKTCAKKLGGFDDDGTMYVRVVGTWRDSIVFGMGSGVLVTDRKAQPRMTLHLENNVVVLAGEQVVVSDDKGVVVLSLPRCRALGSELYLPSTSGGSGDPPEDCPECVLARGDCVVARRTVSWASTVWPEVLADGAVAFNDDGITEKTHYVDATSRGWEVQTNAYGGVAGDGDHVYAVSKGLDGDGPFRLLALSRETGKVVWQTVLPAPKQQPKTIRVIARDGMVAARIDGVIYVVDLARKT